MPTFVRIIISLLSFVALFLILEKYLGLAVQESTTYVQFHNECNMKDIAYLCVFLSQFVLYIALDSMYELSTPA
jgi:hypothetical protein